MSSDYTGEDTYHAIIQVPSDGDERDAASVGVPFKSLADNDAHFQAHCAFFDQTCIVTAVWGFANVVHISSTGTLEVDSGGTLLTEVGSASDFKGSVVFDGNVIFGNSTPISVAVNSGSTLTCASGGAVVCASGSTTTFQIGSNVNYQIGCEVNMAGLTSWRLPITMATTGAVQNLDWTQSDEFLQGTTPNSGADTRVIVINSSIVAGARIRYKWLTKTMNITDTIFRNATSGGTILARCNPTAFSPVLFTEVEF